MQLFKLENAMKQFIFAILCFLSFLLNSCNLDILPEDEIAGEDAIDNILTAREALHAAYRSYPKSNMTFALLSEDFFPTYLISRSSSLSLLYKWDTKEIELASNQLWIDFYKTISDLNTLLISEKYLKINSEKEQEQWNTIKGEAYALKAIAYFDLINIYSSVNNENSPGIILKDKVELEYLPRSSVNTCMTEIKRLSKEASDLLLTNASKEINANNRTHNYIGYYALTLFRARVALSEHDYITAKDYCETIIADIGYKNALISLNSYNDLWTDKTSDEKLFAFSKQTFLFSQYVENSTNGDYIAIPSQFDYEDSDIRKGIASFEFKMKANGHSELINRNLMGKYRTGIADYTPKDINYIRLPEAYFILSECYAELGSLDKAISTLNIFLSKRGAKLISKTINKSLFIEQLFLEKQREFHGEGMNYFEMKRLRKDIKRYNVDNELIQSTISKEDFRLIFPIPLSELKNNPHISQNAGWTDIL